MKKFKLLSLLLIISLFAGVLSAPALALDDPVTAAQYVVLMDANSGDVLYEKDADTAFFPGALGVLMTALVVGDSLDRLDIRLDDLITVPDTVGYNITEGADLIGIVPGESLTVEQLLYAAVLVSANDGANALAEYAAGSYDAFVEAMNSKAEELGCEDTQFAFANSIYSDAQRTTAMDLAKIARAVLHSEQVAPAFRAASYTIPATAVAGERPLTSPNALLNGGEGQYYELAYAGKTATTDIGSHLVAAASYNGIDVIAVVIGCPEGTDRFAETRALFDWVFANFGYRTLVSTTDILDTIPVSMGSPDSVSVSASDNIQILMPSDQEVTDLSLDLDYQYEREGTDLLAPINVGEYLGDLTVSVAGKERGGARLVAATAVDISRLDYLRSQLNVLLENQSVRQVVTILLGALGVYLLLVLIYVIQRIVHLHSLRKARKARARTRAQQELGWLELPQGEDGAYLPESAPDAPVEEDQVPEEELPVEEVPPAEGETEFIKEEAEPTEEEVQAAEEEAQAAEEEAQAAEEEPEPIEEEPEPVEEEPEPVDEEPEPVEEEPEPVEEEPEPVDEGPEPVEEEPEPIEEEPEPVEEEPEPVEEEPEPVEEEPEFIEEEPEPVEDDEDFIDDGEFLEDDEDLDEEEFLDEDEDEEFIDDEDDGGDEPPEQPKRHWWKRK